MHYKNHRIIINEDHFSQDIDMLEQSLADFFETDARFSMDDIKVSVEEEINYDNMRREMTITVTNYSKKLTLGGIYAGQTIDAFAHITYATDLIEPQFVMNGNVPEFYYVFSFSGCSITNSETWQNNKDSITVEDIIFNEVLPKCSK